MTRRRHATLILGPHRSGTSCVAEVLHRLGHDPGRALLGAHACNTRGLWENAAIVSFNEQLLAGRGTAWFDPGFSAAAPPETGPSAALTQLLQTQFAVGTAPIMLKDPRLCRLLPDYLPALRALDYRIRGLIVLRDPWASAASLYSRDGLPPETGLALWAAHLLGALELAAHAPCRILHYDTLVTAAAPLLAELTEWLEAADAAPPPDGLRDIPDPRLRHFVPGAPLPLPDPAAPLAALAQELFAVLRAGWDPERDARRHADWVSRFQSVLTGPGWLTHPLLIVCHQAADDGALAPPLAALPDMPEGRPGLLLVRDGGATPLPAALAAEVAAGRIGLFFNLQERGEDASLVRGIGLAGGHPVLLTRRRGLDRLPGLLDAIRAAPDDRPVGLLDAAAPIPTDLAALAAALLALRIPAALARTLDPWPYVGQGAAAWTALLAALRAGASGLALIRAAPAR